jgi:hypothetical protein
MARLPKFTLTHSDKKDQWVLQNEANRIVETGDIKAEATTRGELKEAVGENGGSVRIEKLHGGYEEQRTFPKSRDPKKTPG